MSFASAAGGLLKPTVQWRVKNLRSERPIGHHVWQKKNPLQSEFSNGIKQFSRNKNF